ncbi:hypothetical protein [Pelagibius marinus]|uniref:hypothetical protein n=1 Tax=Pelagibius marinus TaxID=2762760 RepID=UPI001873031D|nr:hypothetical protein [Pelagibius marinus]
MAVVRIVGWKRDLRKISHTTLIREYAGLGLAQSKAITDRLLEGEEVDVEVDARKTEEFLARLRELGAIAELAAPSDVEEG